MATDERRKTHNLPEKNSAYASPEYWEERFATEEHYEWLESPEALLPLLLPLLGAASRVLFVGCGSSELSDALVARGVQFVFNLDFSPTVLHAKRRHEREAIRKYRTSLAPAASPAQARAPVMEYLCADMTRLDFLRPETYDVVIDKAAMDALMTEEGSVWDPRAEVRAAADRYLAGVSRCLKPGGLFIQITFQQPHFRRRYLLKDFSMNLSGDAHLSPCEPSPSAWLAQRVESFPTPQKAPEAWLSSEAYSWNFFHVDIEKEQGCFSNFLFLAQKTTN
ncbi:hypothetical protein BESB_080120 [Besnoitia besnoiti]|uniref:Methyltransferase type 11 domain-containing protein n=1 Tax=Besnoitia besnoiti TaxID=94643 RepID=A0A2A9MCX2_BESBE|nr:hypothetical protein BESB_080120 [Besnoitia besnoiti]PFH33796.1 hypothetical protein BESB_080120 [Besnoitia besnoiti]